MDLKNSLEKILGRYIIKLTDTPTCPIIEVNKKDILHVLNLLKNNDLIRFNFLSDIVGVDNLTYLKTKDKGKGEKKEETITEDIPRFEINYILLSLETNKRLIVKTRISEEDPTIDSVTSLWKAANWGEREVYDMFGIKFKGHPDLRRILMWEEFTDYPLRKDYPLEGKGEKRKLIYD